MRTSATSFIASAAAACALVVAGCAVTPEPLKSEDVRKRYAADQYLLYAEQEPITTAIDLNTAIARALKYNLDYRLKLMERALATGLWDVSRYDMLPKVVASAGYATRNNDSGGTSVSIPTGQQTLSPSTSQERNRWLANAEFSWNLLDFGLSYYRAKQLADETLISEERRRRVIQNIVQDTRSAYWRAVGAQRLAKKADDLLVRVRWALERSRRAEAEGLLPPVKALAYQRDLLDATTLLNIRRQELEFSKRELAALMNVTPGTNFTLANEPEPSLPPPPRNIGELEEVALEHRPELREEDYRKRISVAETRKALLSLLPGISIDFAGRYDSNRYLYNQSWIDGGIQIFSNLMRLLAYPSVEKANELRLKADDARRVALSMAVLTQVRVAVQRYELSLVDLDLAEQSNQVDSRLAQYARVALSMRVDSELELVRTEARALIAEFQRYASYANARAAYGRILNSLGVDVLPDEVQSAQVDTLAKAVASEIKKAERETFPVALAPAKREAPTILVKIENVKGQALKEAAEAAAIRVLRSAGYRIDGREPGALRLLMRFDLTRVSAGVDRGAWDIRLQRADGTLVGHAEYSSPLAAQFQPSTMDAFTDAATVSQLSSLSSWLNAEKSRPGRSLVQADAAQQEVQNSPAAAQPLAQDDQTIRAPVAAWAQAWAAKDLENYLGSYAPGFKPADGQSRRAWEKQRRLRISGPDRIQVSISDVRVLQRNDDRAAVVFRQDYRSDRYRDSVQKRLELVRAGERWLIAEEQVVATLSDTDALPAETTVTAWKNEESSPDVASIAQPDAARQSAVEPVSSATTTSYDAAASEQSLSASAPTAVATPDVTEAASPEASVSAWYKAKNTSADPAFVQADAAQQEQAEGAPAATPQPAEGDPAIRAPLEAWAQAWAAQDVERYLGSYAPGFKPAGGQSRIAWEKLRRHRVTEPRRIELSISGMQVLRGSEDRVMVSFRQDYRSNLYQDSVRKRLGLVRHGSEWLIAEEQVVATLADTDAAPAEAQITARQHKEKPASGSSIVQADAAAQVEAKSVAAWAQAWAAQDVERYLDWYASDFKPTGGQSREAWEKLRRQRVTEPERIELSIHGIQVLQRKEDRVAVVFRQDYRSDRYRDSVRKRLELVQDGDRWLIADERVIARLPKTSATAYRNSEKSRSRGSFVRTSAAGGGEVEAVAAWAQAWAAQDVERYLDSYAPDFTPMSGQSRKAWEQHRRARISEPDRIMVAISGIRVAQRNNERMSLVFRQDYRSERYQDSVRKRLELVRSGERWLIAEERVVAKLSDSEMLPVADAPPASAGVLSRTQPEPGIGVSAGLDDRRRSPTSPDQSI